MNEMRTQYKIVETLRGFTSNSWEPIGDGLTIPYPGDYTRTLPNTGLRSAKPGKKVLGFSSPYFDSCQVVPATPSALSAVRNTVPAPKRVEDMLIRGLL